MIVTVLMVLAVILMPVRALALVPKGDASFIITRLNTPTITIGGKQMKKGDAFRGSSVINWTDDKQSMEVKDASTGLLYRFSKKVLASKGSLGTIKDFFLRTSKGSTRGIGRGLGITRGENADSYPESRLALVMGNSNYQDLSYLRNAQKDADDVARSLVSLGFDVIQVYEATGEEMKAALDKFADISGNYDVALFYYAGHGIQDAGRNYLVPVEVSLQYKSELKDCLCCEDIVSKLEESDSKGKIIVLDACRDTRSGWSRSSGKGLARMEGSIGSVIVFSTQSGNVASDGEGDNSPFAASLINNMQKPGQSFSETMNGVVRDTYEATDRNQYPLVVGTLLGDFSFNATGKKLSGISGVKVSPRVEREEARIPSKPKVVTGFAFDVPEIDIKLGGVKLMGTTVMFTLQITNNTSRDLSPRICNTEPCDGIETAVFDQAGNKHKLGVDMTCSIGEQSLVFTPQFDLPAGVPRMLQFRVKNVPSGSTMLPRLTVKFRDFGSGEAYGMAELKITNIPLK